MNLIEKIQELGYSDKVASAVFDVIVTLDSFEFSDKELEDVFDLLSNHGMSELESVPNFTEDMWEPFSYGNVRPGDFIRVSKNAYDSPTGEVHNGRVGILVTISGRRCTVRYIGVNRLATITHPIDNLESIKFRML